MTTIASLGFLDGPGLATASTVAFQRCAGLKADGIAGPITKRAIEAADRDELHRGRVADYGITVHGAPFVEWFARIRTARLGLFPHKLAREGFETVFAHARTLGMGVGLTVREFVALLCIFYNETGGTLQSISELGGPSYCFGTNGGAKASYNIAANGNRRAGDLLKARGVISSPADVALWNGTTWPAPAPGTPLYRAALECDFYKYRGRGLCQITWRNAYQSYVDPAIRSVSEKTSEQLSNADLDTVMGHSPAVYCLAAAMFFHDPHWGGPAFAAVNADDFETLGKRVSGSATYASLYARRCQAILSEAGAGIRVPEVHVELA